MSFPVAIGNIVQTRCWSTLGDQASVQVRHVRIVGISAGVPTDEDIAVVLDSQLAPAMKALMCNLASYRGVEAQIIWPLPLRVTVAGSTPGAGTAGADPLPKQASGIIGYSTANAGRAQRGRTYLPFPSQSDNTATGTPTGGYSTRAGVVQTIYGTPDTIVGIGGTCTIQPVIWHRATHTYDDITFSYGDGKWATQRRRGDFGRPNASPL